LNRNETETETEIDNRDNRDNRYNRMYTRMDMYNRMDRFPRSLALIGLCPGFTQRQFNEIMQLERSDYIRELAHQEWSQEQDPRYDNANWRWHLSYVSTKNESTVDMNWNSRKNSKEP
jgi:hypothetical protein